MYSKLLDGTEAYKGADIIKGKSEAGVVSEYYYDNDIKSEKVVGILTPQENECDFLRNPTSDDNSAYLRSAQDFTSTEFYLHAKIPDFSRVLSKIKEQSIPNVNIYIDVEANTNEDATFRKIETYTININNIANVEEKFFTLRLDHIINHESLIFNEVSFRLLLRDEENILVDSFHSAEFSSNKLCNAGFFGEVTTTTTTSTTTTTTTTAAPVPIDSLTYSQAGGNLRPYLPVGSEPSIGKFGFAVSINGVGNIVAVSNPYHNGSNQGDDRYGSVYVYMWNGSNWYPF